MNRWIRNTLVTAAAAIAANASLAASAINAVASAAAPAASSPPSQLTPPSSGYSAAGLYNLANAYARTGKWYEAAGMLPQPQIIGGNYVITFTQPVTAEGTGGMTITFNDGGTGGDFLFTGKGRVAFWDTSSSLVMSRCRSSATSTATSSISGSATARCSAAIRSS